MDQQTRLLGRLIRIIGETFEFRRSQGGDQLIGLPSADGMTLVFFGDPVAPVRCATEIARGLQSYPELKLRIGLHSGPVYRMVGIDARANVAGEAIKTAQRIMSAGDAEHILLSKPVADTLSHLGNWTKCLSDLGEREITPGVRLQLFNLYTGEVGNPERPCEFPAMLPSTPAAGAGVAAAPFSSAEAAVPVASLGERKKVRPMLIVTLAVFAIAAVIAGYLILKPESQAVRPLLSAEFAENFVSLEEWERPLAGWTFANESLQIEDQPQIGYPRDVICEDFTMEFHLKLINDGGAAWALRVKDPNNYYLFYLCGPSGETPNFFLTYVVRDGKKVQKRADRLLVPLVVGGEYQISIDAKKDQISHKIKSDNEEQKEAGEFLNLGLFVDVDHTYPTGGVGFRTFAKEKFAVHGLYVRPPGLSLPE